MNRSASADFPSRIHLPEPLQTLMTNDDSPILDFYPDDFEIDMNGKKMAWQGVALLPFIDQHRLLAALKSKESELTDEEKRRNRWGDNVMFVSEGNRLYETFCGLYTLKAATKVSTFSSRCRKRFSFLRMGRAAPIRQSTEQFQGLILTTATTPRHDIISRNIRLCPSRPELRAK
jgi:5'-3' exonuclease